MTTTHTTVSDHEAIKHAAVNAIVAIVDVIASAGADGVPSGHLYNALMGQGCRYDQYVTIIGKLKMLGVVRESNNVLYAVTGN